MGTRAVGGVDIGIRGRGIGALIAGSREVLTFQIADMGPGTGWTTGIGTVSWQFFDDASIDQYFGTRADDGQKFI